jgi:F0F1-type ATP synthase assembly protein I
MKPYVKAYGIGAVFLWVAVLLFAVSDVSIFGSGYIGFLIAAIAMFTIGALGQHGSAASRKWTDENF